jgi:hypothetical protein
LPGDRRIARSCRRRRQDRRWRWGDARDRFAPIGVSLPAVLVSWTAIRAHRLRCGEPREAGERKLNRTFTPVSNGPRGSPLPFAPVARPTKQPDRSRPRALDERRLLMARNLGAATIGLGSEVGVPAIGGFDPTVLSLPSLAPDESLILRPSDRDGAAIENWALGLDIYVPQPSTTFVSLLQTGGGDGDLFLRDNGDGTAGVGVAGVYDGAFAFDQWNRLIVTFTTEGGVTILRKYLNGAQIGGAQNLGATDRWDIDTVAGLKLFADDSAETAPVTLSGVFFSPFVPPPADVAGLVASIALPNAFGFFPGAPVPGAIELDFANEDVAPRYGAAEVILEGFDFRTPVQINDSAIAFATQFGIAGPGGEDVPVLDYAGYGPDEGVLIRLPGIVGDLSSYTAVWDINVDALGGFQALLQTDPSQSGDADLFINGAGGIGIGGDYDGAVAPGVWNRIAITVADLGSGSATLSKYLNGVFLDSQTVDADRFTLDAASGFLLLTDDDGETGEGFLAHFGLSSEVLDAAAIAALAMGPSWPRPAPARRCRRREPARDR